MVEKYTQIRDKIFDDEFDGTMDIEFIKLIKSLDRNFIKIMPLELIEKNKTYFESFTKLKDREIMQTAILLLNSINNPKKYKFDDIEY
jgi:hypothetical protein